MYDCYYTRKCTRISSQKKERNLAIRDIVKMNRPCRYGQNTKTTDEEEIGEEDMEIVSLKMAMQRKDLRRKKSLEGEVIKES